ncbi:MAG: hypothetical protein ACM369_08480 [Acidobacteriota bacterium]
MRDHSASMRRAALLLSLILLSASACRRERDPVMACLTGAVASAEARDADGVMSRVAEGFRDAEGGGKADAAGLVRRSLAAYEWLSLTLSDVAIERGPAAAQAKFKVRMSGRPRAVGGLEGLLPRSSNWSFDVRLEPGTGGWKIVWASWTRLEGGD